MDQRLDTVKKLYDWSSNGYGNDSKISITLDALAALCAYATSVGVRDAHVAHANIIAACRERANNLRYRHMALTVLPDSDYLYDPRHADAEEMGDWETNLEVKEA